MLKNVTTVSFKLFLKEVALQVKRENHFFILINIGRL